MENNEENGVKNSRVIGSTYKRKEFPVGSKAFVVNYKDSRILQRFISERGKILPRRVSSVSSKGQRMLAIAIKRARFLALLPYVAD